MGVFEGLKESTLYFSSLKGIKVFPEENNKPVGQLSDFFVNYEDVYPEVLAIQIIFQSRFFFIHWRDIKFFSLKKIILRRDAIINEGKTLPRVKQQRLLTGLLSAPYDDQTIHYPGVAKVVLDRQIVDTMGKKVVRVNDLHFIRIGQNLRITHAAAGFRSMVRRLGHEPIIATLEKLIPKLAKPLQRDRVISWKCVHAIADSSVQQNVKLNITDDDLKNIHPADLADILEDLDGVGKTRMLASMEPELAAQTLTEVESDQRGMLLKDIEEDRLGLILDHLGPDEAVDLIGDLDEREQVKVMENVADEEHKQEIIGLLDYEEETAGGIMSTEVLSVAPEFNQEQILHKMKNEDEDLETIYDFYIVNQNNMLIGHCSLRNLLNQKPQLPVEDFMEDQNLIFVTPDDHWKKVASTMSKYNLINIPVVDRDKTLLGIISVDDILPWALNER